MLRLCIAFVLLFMPTFAAADVSGSLRVVDGDTIVVDDTRIRLHAIDAPEQGQVCVLKSGAAFDCGAWSTAQVRDRFEGRFARCTPLETDKYGRTVAKCDVGGADMGEVIVSEGWAFAYRRFGMDYDLAEKSAYVAARGLHGAKVQSPAAFRAEERKTTHNTGCVIKGNISKNGRIFHVPGQAFYRQTQINEARGERWFCSAKEARAAGWRAARQ